MTANELKSGSDYEESASDRDLRPFNQSLPMQLMTAREEVMLRFRPHLHAHGLTDQQWRIIRALMEVESREILDLSDVCGIHPASLSRILPKLDAAGIINRRPNKADQRRVIVTIAAKGRHLFNQIAPESERLYSTITSDIGQDLMHEAYDVLERMIQALRTKRRAGDRATAD